MPDTTPQPPAAPTIQRRLRFGRGQAIGIGAILLIVLLAIAGAFGIADATVRATEPPVSVSVTYPSLLRYKVDAQLEITVAIGNEAVEDLAVVIAADYLDAFSEVAFQPEIDLSTATERLIRVDDPMPRETRVITGQVQAERYWLHEGWLEVRSGADTLARVTFSTFVYP